MLSYSKYIGFILVSCLLFCAGCAAPATPAPTATSLPPTATPVPPTPVPVPTSTTPITRGKVDIGGREMYINCAGEGAPTILLDAGWSFGVNYWTNLTGVMPLLNEAVDVRVCAYDRLSIGMSDAAPYEPRTNQVMAQDLHQLLANANIQGPFIYVGHSLSGFTGRLFAKAYPGDVAGLVLIDGVHPEWDGRMLDLIPAAVEGEPKGITNIRWEFTDRRTKPLSCFEFWDIQGSAALVQASGDLGDLPLVVLSRDPDATEQQREFNDWMFGSTDFPLDLTQEMDKVWAELQDDLATLSTNSTHLIAENTNHNIPLRNPESVVDAVRMLVEGEVGQ